MSREISASARLLIDDQLAALDVPPMSSSSMNWTSSRRALRQSRRTFEFTSIGTSPRPMTRRCSSSRKKYVAVFDLKRRCCLYLTYHPNGDTRMRGMALVRFKETYARNGFACDTGELPDFLPMLLEFGSHGGDAALAAQALIDEHREGLTVLHAALEKVESPQRHILAGVLATLPELTDAQRRPRDYWWHRVLRRNGRA